MSDLVINKKNFDETLKKLENMALDNKQTPEFNKFEENRGGLLKVFPKKVTGEEMNAFADQVKGGFILANQKTNDIYRQLIEIYNAFEYLDKEYIAGILNAFNQAIEATKKAEDAQKDIDSTLDFLKMEVEMDKKNNEEVNDKLEKINLEIDQIKLFLDKLKSQIEIVETQKKDIGIEDNDSESKKNEAENQIEVEEIKVEQKKIDIDFNNDECENLPIVEPIKENETKDMKVYLIVMSSIILAVLVSILIVLIIK